MSDVTITSHPGEFCTHYMRQKINDAGRNRDLPLRFEQKNELIPSCFLEECHVRAILRSPMVKPQF